MGPNRGPPLLRLSDPDVECWEAAPTNPLSLPRVGTSRHIHRSISLVMDMRNCAQIGCFGTDSCVGAPPLLFSRILDHAICNSTLDTSSYHPARATPCSPATPSLRRL